MLALTYLHFYRLFTSGEIKRINQLSIYDMLMCITDMEWNDIPKNPFRVPTEGISKSVHSNLNSPGDN